MEVVRSTKNVVEKWEIDVKVIIIMFSGGLDSAALLYKMLSESSMEKHIVAHHINFINRENRHVVEKHACDSIVTYLEKTVRPFDYTESTFEFPYTQHIGWDIITAMYVGGLVSKNYIGNNKEVELCIGDNKDDFGSYQWKSPIAQSIGLLASLESPMQSVQHLPTIVQPIVHLSKEDLINMIPPKLFDLTWSCRRPKLENQNMFVECGVCSTCNELKKLNRFTEKRWSVVT